MSYNYNKLLGKIAEKYGTQSQFASALGLTEGSLSKKLNKKGILSKNKLQMPVNY